MALRRTRENDRRGERSVLLIVGLANPGADMRDRVTTWAAMPFE